MKDKRTVQELLEQYGFDKNKLDEYIEVDAKTASNARKMIGELARVQDVIGKQEKILVKNVKKIDNIEDRASKNVEETIKLMKKIDGYIESAMDYLSRYSKEGR